MRTLKAKAIFHTVAEGRIGVSMYGQENFFGPIGFGGVYVDNATEQKLRKILVDEDIAEEDVRDYFEKISELCPTDYINMGPESCVECYERDGNLDAVLAEGFGWIITRIFQNVRCDIAVNSHFENKVIRKKLMHFLNQRKSVKIRLRLEQPLADDVAVRAASIVARDTYELFPDYIDEEYRTELPLLPKGESSQEVIETAKYILHEYGASGLRRVAKLHFDTTKSVITNPDQLVW